MIIQVTDDYELRCNDGINWQVYKLKSREKRGRDHKSTGVFEDEWIALKSYHGSIESGVRWIVNDMPKTSKNREERKTLEAYIGEMGKLVNKVSRSISKKVESGELK